jgi:alcohol dehydrogenase
MCTGRSKRQVHEVLRVMNAKYFIGPGNLRHLQEVLNEISAARVLLVTGYKSFSLSGAESTITNVLAKRQYYHLRQDSKVVELEALDASLAGVRSFGADSVIAVGGGTALDAGKLLAVLSCNKCSALDLATADLSNSKSLPLIAIPTTAGTGSEATHFAVAYIAGRKVSIASPCMLPCAAIVDAELMASLPAYETACTGMDALSQAIESYWSRKSTEASRKFAAEAITLAYNNLPQAVQADSLARIAMAKAAYLSGKAIDLTATTAPHAFSYGFTFDFGVPHGHAVALTLPMFFNYNAQSNDPKIQDICKLLGVGNAQEASEALHLLMTRIGLKTSLSGLGIEFGQLEGLANRVDPKRLSNNPRAIEPHEILPLLQGLYREEFNV